MAYTLVPTELIVDGAITSAKLDTNIAISGTLGVTGEVTLATHLIMGDNDKIKIGTGGDLEIYHDGSNSYISNSTGNIYLGDTNGAVHIQAKLNEESIICAADGAVSLYHDNAVKLATSSAGVTVTGTLAATLSTAAQPNITSVGTLTALTGGTGDLNWDSGTLFVDSSANAVGIGTSSPSAPLNISATYSSNTTEQFRIQDNTGGKLDFFGYANGGKGIQAYADDGSTFYNLNLQPLGGNVGIGTDSPTRKLSISGTGSEYINIVGGTSSGVGLLLGDSNAEINAAIICDNSTDSLSFRTGGNNTRMTIDSSGNVGYSGKLFSSNATGTLGGFQLYRDHTNGDCFVFDTTTAPYAGDLIFGTTNTERMRISSGGAIQHSAAAGSSAMISRANAPSGSQGLNITASVVTGLPTTTPTFADNSSSGASIYLGGNAVDQYGGSVILKAYGAGADGNLIVFENRSGANTFKETMRINSDGNVTSPYTSGFQVTGTSGEVDQSSSGSQSILSDRFNTAGGAGGHNIGGDYNTSTGIYTAPVDGRYLFGYTFRWETGSFIMSNYLRTYISINDGNDFSVGHQINGRNEAFTSFMAMSGSAIVSLSAGDTVRVKGGLHGGTGKFYASESSFYGILMS